MALAVGSLSCTPGWSVSAATVGGESSHPGLPGQSPPWSLAYPSLGPVCKALSYWSRPAHANLPALEGLISEIVKLWHEPVVSPSTGPTCFTEFAFSWNSNFSRFPGSPVPVKSFPGMPHFLSSSDFVCWYCLLTFTRSTQLGFSHFLEGVGGFSFWVSWGYLISWGC